MSDYYKDLGVEKGASEKEIKAAHRKRVKETHPDYGGNSAEFEKVSRAALILRDPEKRKHYDEYGKDKEEQKDVSLDLIASIFNSMIESDLPPTFDYLKGVKETLLNMTSEAMRQALHAERAIKKFEKLQTKFRRKKDKKEGGNFFQIALGSKIRNEKERIDRTNEVLRNSKQALRVLDDYEFEPDKDESPKDAIFRTAFTFR